MQSIKFLGHIFDENGVRLSDSRVQGIRDLPANVCERGWKFYRDGKLFQDFIKGLSSHLIPLTQLSKKNAAQKCFEMTAEAREAIFRVKDLLVHASQLVIMNETDPLILYTETSTVSIGGVLMQEQIRVSCRITRRNLPRMSWGNYLQ